MERLPTIVSTSLGTMPTRIYPSKAADELEIAGRTGVGARRVHRTAMFTVSIPESSQIFERSPVVVLRAPRGNSSADGSASILAGQGAE